MEVVRTNNDSVRAQRLPSSDFWNPVAETKHRLDALSGLLQDFWQPAVGKEIQEPPQEDVAAPAESPNDFWSFDNVPMSPNAVPEDWGEQAPLPWFDPELAENPFIVQDHPPSVYSMAERRSRWLVQLLDIPEKGRRRTLALYFHELFEEFPFQQTFVALSDIAKGGANADSLKNGCEFRLTFLNTPTLASRRSVGSRQPSPYHNPGALLSWKRAVRLAELCHGHTPSDIIDDDWFQEWLALQFGDVLYWSYIDYIEWRLRSADLGYIVLDLPHSREEWMDADLRSSLLPPRSFSRSGSLHRGQTDIIGVAYPEPNSPSIYIRSRRGTFDARSRLLG